MRSETINIRGGRWVRVMGGCLLAGGVLLGGGGQGGGPGSTAFATVPPSLAPRTHEASVEGVIQTLQAKAEAAADGVWASSSERQDLPGVPWLTGLSGSQWYWRTTVQDRGYRNYTLFSDGQWFYDLPHRRRFAIDGLESGPKDYYGYSYYLLHLNLRPRQLLEAAGGLKHLGDRVIEGVTYAHLQADPERDQAFESDPYLNPKQARRRIDYYYDPAHQAIAGVEIHDRRGGRQSAWVRQWDRFGTAHDWPKKIAGHLTPRKGQQGLPYLIQVDSFTAGEDPQMAVVKQAMQSQPFFAADTHLLRAVSVHAAAVAAEPGDLSARVALAQASFGADRPAQAVEQWLAVEGRLGEEPDRQFLNQVLLRVGAASVKQGSLEEEQRAASVEIILRAVDFVPPEDSRDRIPLTGILQAWQVLRQYPQYAPRLEAAEGKLIERLVASKGPNLAEELWRMARKEPAIQQKLDEALSRGLADPRSGEAYGNTIVAPHVAAAVEWEQWERAGQLLSNLRWPPETPESARAMATVLQRLLEIRPQALAGAEQASAALAECYSQAFGEGLREDRHVRELCRRLAVRWGAAATAARQADPQAASAQQQVTASADQPRAMEYWRAVIDQLLEVRSLEPDQIDARFAAAAELAAACQGQMNLTDLRGRTHLRIGRLQALKRRVYPPAIPAASFQQALTAADSDALRLETINAWVGLWMSLREYPAAAQAVREAQPLMQSEAARQSVQSLATLLEALPQVRAGAAPVGSLLAGGYGLAPGEPEDQETADTRRQLAVALGAQAILARRSDPQASTAAQLVEASAAQPQAGAYWEAVIQRLLTLRSHGPAQTQEQALEAEPGESEAEPQTLEAEPGPQGGPLSAEQLEARRQERQFQLMAVGELAAACQSRFDRPGLESRTWLAAGHSTLINTRLYSPLARLEHFNRAFAAADSDADRLEAIQAIVGVREEVGQHEEALQTLAGLRQSLQTPAAQEQADALEGEIQQNQAAYAAAAQRRQNLVEIDRLEGQAAFLRQRLAEAQQRNRPAEDIASIETMVQQAQQELEAARQ